MVGTTGEMVGTISGDGGDHGGDGWDNGEMVGTIGGDDANMLCEAVKFAKLFSLTSLSVEQDAVASHTYLIGFF